MLRISSVSTRYFPLLFLSGGILFAVLFLEFYGLVFESIDGIFKQQSTSALQYLRTSVQESHGEFVRETKILHLSRGAQRHFATIGDHDRIETSVDALRQLGLKWHGLLDDETYRAVSYLSADGEPLTVLDFHKHHVLSNTNAISAPIGEAVDTQAREGSLTIVESWKIGAPPRTGSRVVVLNDSSKVLRTIFPVNHRKTNARIGYVAVDRQLEAVITWDADKDKELLIFNSESRRVIYDSSTRETNGTNVDETYSHLLSAHVKQSADAHSTSAKIAYEGREYLVTRSTLSSPPWEIIATILLDPYIGEAEERGRILIVASLFFIAVGGYSIYTLTARVRRRSAELELANEAVSAHNQQLEQELQTAHDMQMGLMPSNDPIVTGYDIVGRCRPATEVGGDFYQYFSLEDGRLIIALADVTGHGMQAAVPTMVFSGLLDTQINYTPSPDELMPRLNSSLHRVLERRTFVCFTMAELETTTSTIRLSNGGCPYPFFYRAATQQVEEIDLSAFPLGVRAESSYRVAELELNDGDIIVLCSDGIIESSDVEGNLFGFDRTADAIRQMGIQCASSTKLVKHVFDIIEDFAGTGAQEDDQTMVAIRATPSATIRN